MLPLLKPPAQVLLLLVSACLPMSPFPPLIIWLSLALTHRVLHAFLMLALLSLPLPLSLAVPVPVPLPSASASPSLLLQLATRLGVGIAEFASASSLRPRSFSSSLLSLPPLPS